MTLRQPLRNDDGPLRPDVRSCTVAQAAHLLGINESEVIQLIQNGVLLAEQLESGWTVFLPKILLQVTGNNQLHSAKTEMQPAGLTHIPREVIDRASTIASHNEGLHLDDLPSPSASMRDTIAARNSNVDRSGLQASSRGGWVTRFLLVIIVSILAGYGLFVAAGSSIELPGVGLSRGGVLVTRLLLVSIVTLLVGYGLFVVTVSPKNLAELQFPRGGVLVLRLLLITIVSVLVGYGLFSVTGAPYGKAALITSEDSQSNMPVPSSGGAVGFVTDASTPTHLDREHNKALPSGTVLMTGNEPSQADPTRPIEAATSSAMPTEEPTRTAKPTSPPVPSPSPAVTYRVAPAEVVLNKIAHTVTSVRSGALAAVINYGEGTRGTADVRFDMGPEGEPRAHMITTYHSDSGTQVLEGVAIGSRVWQRENGGAWQAAANQESVWGQVQAFLPQAANATQASIKDTANTTEIRWYDAARDTDVTVVLDPANSEPRKLRQFSRATGSILDVTYKAWNQPVQIAAP